MNCFPGILWYDQQVGFQEVVEGERPFLLHRAGELEAREKLDSNISCNHQPQQYISLHLQEITFSKSTTTRLVWFCFVLFK